MQQLLLPLSTAQTTSAAEKPFFTDAGNRHAWFFIHAWPRWPGRGVIIYGPPGCGKSYLAHTWQQRSAAFTWPLPDDLSFLFEGPTPHLMVNNLHDHLRTRQECERLLAAYNILQERKGSCLLTDTAPPTDALPLPDLSSRLKTLYAIPMDVPSDGLLRQVLSHLFHNHQQSVSPDVIHFLIPRIERSMGHLKTLVDHLITESLRHKRPITVDFAKKILAL